MQTITRTHTTSVSRSFALRGLAIQDLQVIRDEMTETEHTTSLRNYETNYSTVDSEHTNQSMRARFNMLIEQWHIERRYISSLSKLANCPSYREIVGMGPDALPFIFAQMRSEGNDPDHWDIALTEITGEDPVPESSYGDSIKIARAWLDWAHQHGF